ncbi:Arv1-like family-domain-containing protein [Boeremia exigua]|uniref:Arv1-like family-domain-containing protein n=1 Tax=Boeremia exigua TaxID=749465 RepID=UPI001E8D4AF4|nr:Arv1-like family-domain-containing protein [Boeremia exigua]KAH6611995.1 Arv1-like family-domain-containing protein [Boeremia exigua]
MPICIECRYPVKTLYTEYSKADDRALGKGVRLTQCPRCKKFADKYVEHDFVVLFIDLVLIKPQVYRHLLFNRLGRDDDKFDRSILRLGILLLLFDVYLTWARIEKLPLPPDSPHHASTPASLPPTNAAILQAQPLILQYLFFLALVTLSTLAFHLPIRLLTGLNPASLPPALRCVWSRFVPYYPHPTPLTTALLVSSCTKLFPILLIIWDYDLPSSATAVSWAVIVNNVAALEILMDCGYVRAGLLVGVGAGLRWVVAGSVVRQAGLGVGWEDEGGEIEGILGGVESWIKGVG